VAQSLEDLKSTKNEEAYRKAVSSADQAKSDLASQLTGLIKEAESLDQGFAKSLTAFAALLDERFEKLKSKNARVSAFVTSAKQTDDKKKEILAFMETADKELKGLAEKLGRLANELES
jgi:hypothetical protein